MPQREHHIGGSSNGTSATLRKILKSKTNVWIDAVTFDAQDCSNAANRIPN